MAKRTLVPRDQPFSSLVLSHVEEIETSIATLDQDGALEALAKSSALSDMARKIKADIGVVNALIYTRLLCCAQYGRAIGRHQGKGGGRGKKKLPKAALGSFSDPTLANYRKLGDHMERIKQYHECVSKFNNHTDKEGITMAVTDCIDYLAAPSDEQYLKAKENKENKRKRKDLKNQPGSQEWYTPAHVIEAARATMGTIDCDPASCKEAQKTVKAGCYFTVDDDGLAQEWHGNVWMNPPYDRKNIKAFTSKLLEEVENGHVRQAVIITNSQTDAIWWHALANKCARICFTLGRISFDRHKGEGIKPTCGQSFFYFGRSTAKFRKQFKQFGTIFPPG